MEEKLLTQETKTHSAQVTTQEEPRPSVYSSVLAIVGFVILIVIVLWGLFHIISLASPFFTSLFNSRNSASIQITAPASVTSGESFALRWKYSSAEKGTYAFLYQCNNAFYFEIPRAEGAQNFIPCGTAFTIPTTDNMITVTPILSRGTASTSVPISIIFMPHATTSKQVRGSATIMVLPSVAPIVQLPEPVAPIAPIAPIATVKPRIPAVQQPRTLTPADLSVRIMGVNVDSSGMAVVEFDIKNEGGAPSGTYYFQAFLPTQSVYTYNSPLQSSLGSGDHVVSTIRFTQAVAGTVSIVVDPSSMVRESNENNNYASQFVNAPYNYQYQQPGTTYYPYTY